ncbi:MAG: hypothetical protein K6T61_11640 [Bryobacteraceae bacterium]|nr:hypothetical protein [Bryobacteraceae bacterium]
MKDRDWSEAEARALLSALRESMKDIEAPARVEAELIEAFRGRRFQVEGGGIRWPRWRWAGLSAAGMVLLAAGIGGWMLREHHLDPPPLVVHAPQAPPEVLRPVKSRPPERVRAGMERRPQKPAGPVAAPAAKAEEVATGFIAVTHPATWPEEEVRQLLRVRLPRSAAAALGVPVNAERADEMLRADVVVGQDGVVRAVRFVQ